jgi:hypothetical protein
LTADGQQFNAFVARSDPGSDLALLVSEAQVPKLEPLTQQRQRDIGTHSQPSLVNNSPLPPDDERAAF